MNKLLNWSIALLLPTLVCCGSRKTQDVPEEIYACPMPGDWDQDEPETEPDSVTGSDSISISQR